MPCAGQTTEPEPLIEASGLLVLCLDNHAEDADLCGGLAGGVERMDDERVAIALALPASIDGESSEQQKWDVFVGSGLNVLRQMIAADGMGADRVIADD